MTAIDLILFFMLRAAGREWSAHRFGRVLGGAVRRWGRRVV